MTARRNPFVLLLGAAELPMRERVLLGTLRAAPHCRIAVATPFRDRLAPRYADMVLSADPSRPTDILREITKQRRESGSNLQAVIPLNDLYMKTGLAVATTLRVPFHSAATVGNCTDKYLMKRRLHDAGLPVARCEPVHDRQTLSRAIAVLGFPLVLKPRNLTGSAGVIRVNSSDEVEKAFRMCCSEAMGLAKKYNLDTSYLAEQYIASIDEVSVEVLNMGKTHKVLAVTDKYLGSEPHFVEIGHCIPSQYSNRSSLRLLAAQACHALGVRRGVAHVEVRIRENGSYAIMEVAARPGGDGIMGLIERVYGYNPYALHASCFMQSRNNRAPMRSGIRCVAAIAFLKAEVGRIRAISRPRHLPKAVQYVQIDAAVGGYSQESTSWIAREGYIECTWRTRIAKRKERRHIRLAQQLSRQIFDVQAQRRRS